MVFVISSTVGTLIEGPFPTGLLFAADEDTSTDCRTALDELFDDRGIMLRVLLLVLLSG